MVHLRSKMFFTVMTDEVALPRKEIPGEVYPLVRLTQKNSNAYLPIMWIDELSQRLDNQVRVNQTDKEADLELVYRQVMYFNR